VTALLDSVINPDYRMRPRGALSDHSS
jgi:hypothetical protein